MRQYTHPGGPTRAYKPLTGPAAASTHVPPWFPTDPNDRLHLLMFSLHTVGAIGAYVMSMYCDVLLADQRAMIPHSIALSDGNVTMRTPQNVSEAQMFRAGFPWSQDSVLPSHIWNPYLLVVVFEWLTAAFAMCTIRGWRDTMGKDWVDLWLGAGVALVAFWFMRHYVFYKTAGAVFPVVMLLLLIPTFIGAALVCYMYLDKCEAIEKVHNKAASDGNPKDQNDLTPPDDPLVPDAYPPPAPENPTEKQRAAAAVPTRKVVVQGRTWQVPQRICMLKTEQIPRQRVRGLGSETGPYYPKVDSEEAIRAFTVAAYDVAFRYAEYCITAPLLFIAVTALLTVDAPAWLYLAGYWLIQACNATGLAYHATLCSDLFRDCMKRLRQQPVLIETTSVVEWMRALLVNGSWYDRGVQHAYLLECSWLCLLLPVGGLVYMVRSWIVSTEVPWIASLMIWLLLVMYCSFGIVPSVVYATYRMDLIPQLPWLLDILNLAAKFPIPILILIAFSTRPNGFHSCSL